MSMYVSYLNTYKFWNLNLDDKEVINPVQNLHDATMDGYTTFWHSIHIWH